MTEMEIPKELLITLETTGRPTNLTLTEHELHVVSIDTSEPPTRLGKTNPGSNAYLYLLLISSSLVGIGTPLSR